jgi:FtsH-binding integral membrane protein
MNTKNKIFRALIFGSLFLPLITSAQQLSRTRTTLAAARDIITNILVPAAFVLALLFFFWGVALYILSIGGDKERGKQIMVWGVVALFVISAVWGIVRYIQVELNVDNTPTIQLPTITGVNTR